MNYEKAAWGYFNDLSRVGHEGLWCGEWVCNSSHHRFMVANEKWEIEDYDRPRRGVDDDEVESDYWD